MFGHRISMRISCRFGGAILGFGSLMDSFDSTRLGVEADSQRINPSRSIRAAMQQTR